MKKGALIILSGVLATTAPGQGVYGDGQTGGNFGWLSIAGQPFISGGVMSGTLIAGGTVNSNKLDAPTLALLGGGGSTAGLVSTNDARALVLSGFVTMSNANNNLTASNLIAGNIQSPSLSGPGLVVSDSSGNLQPGSLNTPLFLSGYSLNISAANYANPGTMSSADFGTLRTNLARLNGTNTFSGTNVFSGVVDFTGAFVYFSDNLDIGNGDNIYLTNGTYFGLGSGSFVAGSTGQFTGNAGGLTNYLQSIDGAASISCSTTTRYVTPGGQLAAGTVGGASGQIGAHAVYFTNLWVGIVSGASAGTNYTATLYTNGVASGITVTVNTSTPGAFDNTHAAPVPGGGTNTYSLGWTASTGSSAVSFTWTMDKVRVN